MPRGNSSSRSGGRRNSRAGAPGKRSSGSTRSSRGDGRGKNSSERRSERPYKKSNRPFGSGSDSPKGRTSKTSGQSFGKSRSRSSEEDAGSFRKSNRPFGSGSDSSKGRTSKTSGQSFSKSRSRSSEGDSGSFRKPNRPFGGSRDGSSGESRPFRKSRRDEGSEKPFSKFQKSPRRSDDAQKDNPRERSFIGKRKFAEEKSFTRKGKQSRETGRAAAPDITAPVQTEKIRLNRYIANSGVCSRREADDLITMGLISVNGKTITELGFKVNPGDEVRYENRILRAEKPVYILMNKPKGYLTTTDDPQERNTVMHIIGSAVKERIYPVGRLDRNTTGLLLLTNDGDLADKLMHPSYNVKKIYKVELDRPLSKNDFEKILEGVRLEEGKALVDDLAILDDGKTVGIELHIGWNRVVRRIFESLNYQVIKLDRSVYAGLDKKDLPRGSWRYLTREEIIRLKHYK